jgi:uncharacterized protein
MSALLATVAINNDVKILSSILPLLQQEKVDAIEWSFDAVTNLQELPEWFLPLMQEVSEQNKLIGHGIYYSIFSGKYLQEQKKWLARVKKITSQFKFNHISEHFGFMTGIDFHKGAPLSVPMNNITLQIGIDRLSRLQEASNCPVGVENLAFAFSVNDAKIHGDFLEKLVAPINGFIILDLHNLYCQVHNFQLSFSEILAIYPLDRVREIHISGGSWDVFNETNIRRDTHDDAVPNQVFEYLKLAIPHCKNLKFITLEQIGSGLVSVNKQLQFQKDFETLKSIIQNFNIEYDNLFLPIEKRIFNKFPVEDELLYHQQLQLSSILENAVDVNDGRRLLEKSNLQNTDWNIQNWSDSMLHTAISIAQKWKDGF